MPHFIRLLFRTACVIIFCISCTPREKFAFFVRLDPGCESHRIAAGVISQRVKALYRKNMAELSGGQVKVTMYADQKLPVRLLLSKGEFYISETYTNAEILPLFVQVDDLLRKEQDTTEMNIDYPFFRLLQVIGNADGAGAVVGYAATSDTAQVNAILNRPDIRILFPVDAGFLWMSKPAGIPWMSELSDSGHLMSLVAVKTTGHFDLTPDMCEKIYSDKTPWGECLSIHLAEKSALEWARLTRDNIGRQLAFVLDNEVLMSPVVNSEITGGRMSISGDFTKVEIEMISAVFKGGKLDCKAELVNE